MKICIVVDLMDVVTDIKLKFEIFGNFYVIRAKVAVSH